MIWTDLCQKLMDLPWFKSINSEKFSQIRAFEIFLLIKRDLLCYNIKIFTNISQTYEKSWSDNPQVDIKRKVENFVSFLVVGNFGNEKTQENINKTNQTKIVKLNTIKASKVK